jgi:Glycosyltransferase family 87
MNDVLKKLGIRAESARQSRYLRGITMGWGRLPEIEDRIFTERRLRFCGSGLVMTYAVAVLLAWALNRGEWVIRPDGSLSNIDFCWIWVSGKFAASSDPSRIYDNSVYAAAQDLFYPPGECLFLHQYVYPPTFLFLTYPLGLMPYLAAFTVWVAATFLVYLAAVYAIIGRLAALIAAAAPSAAIKNIQLGHNGFLTAGLFGLSLASLERQPWLSGILLSLLIYKPQFGVLVPLALLASRNWRALISATAASVILGAAAAVVFGYETWPSFIRSLLDRDAGLSPDAEVELSLQSVYALLHWAGASTRSSWSVHLTVAAIVTAIVCAVWAKPIPYPLKAAILCIASVTVTPYVLAYDLCILSIAVAFLVRDGMSRGFLPGERMGIFFCFAGLFPVATPIAPIICAVLFVLCARRIAAYRCDFLTVSQDEPVG